jgi:hypothetical protein
MNVEIFTVYARARAFFPHGALWYTIAASIQKHNRRLINQTADGCLLPVEPLILNPNF